MHAFFTCKMLTSLQKICFVSRGVVKGRVTASINANWIFVVVIVLLELFFDHEEALESDLDLRLVLGTATPKLLEVIGRLREIFEPNCQLDSGINDLLLVDRSYFRFLVRNFLKFFSELILLLLFDSAEGYGHASQDLISGPGKCLSYLDRVDVGEIFSLGLGQVCLSLRLVDQVSELHHLLALTSLKRFTFGCLVELPEDLRVEPVTILTVLEGIEVSEDELIELG